MALAPDNGGSFDVEVSRVDESSYAFLKSGDAETIDTSVASDDHLLLRSWHRNAPRGRQAGLRPHVKMWSLPAMTGPRACSAWSVSSQPRRSPSVIAPAVSASSEARSIMLA